MENERFKKTVYLNLDSVHKRVYNNTHKGSDTMNTTRLNITLPTSLSNDITNYAEELNEKKSHIIASALDMYFDYLDIRIAEQRLKNNEPTISMDDFFQDLETDV